MLQCLVQKCIWGPTFDWPTRSYQFFSSLLPHCIFTAFFAVHLDAWSTNSSTVFLHNCPPNKDDNYSPQSEWAKSWIHFNLPPCCCCDFNFQILLKILDPDLNVIPPIFTLTELSRGILKRAYMFPVSYCLLTKARLSVLSVFDPRYFQRLAHRLSELIMYFRAVAELSYVIGRCFLFPLPAHPSFAASAASCRIDHLTTQIRWTIIF